MDRFNNFFYFDVISALYMPIFFHMREKLNSLSLVECYSEVTNTSIWKVSIDLIHFTNYRVLTFTRGMLEFLGSFGEILWLPSPEIPDHLNLNLAILELLVAPLAVKITLNILYPLLECQEVWIRKIYSFGNST